MLEAAASVGVGQNEYNGFNLMFSTVDESIRRIVEPKMPTDGFSGRSRIGMVRGCTAEGWLLGHYGSEYYFQQPLQILPQLNAPSIFPIAKIVILIARCWATS